MWHGCQLSQLCLIIGNESRAWWWNFNHQVYYIANITIYLACLVPVFAYAQDVWTYIHVRMHPQVTWQCIFPVADVISHKNMPTSSPQLVSQSIVSIASVVFLQFLMLSSCGVKWFQIEILWIESLLEMLLHCHSPARALVCKHVSLTNDLRQLCHLRHLDVCRSMFCLDASRRGCSASTSFRVGAPGFLWQALLAKSFSSWKVIWSIESIVHFVLLIQGFIYYSAAVPMHQSNYVKERMNEKNVRGNRAQVAWFVLIDLLFVLIAWFVSIVVANCRWWIDGQEERLLQQVERPRLHQLSINQPIHPSHPSIQSIKSINQPTNSINH